MIDTSITRRDGCVLSVHVFTLGVIHPIQSSHSPSLTKIVQRRRGIPAYGMIHQHCVLIFHIWDKSWYNGIEMSKRFSLLFCISFLVLWALKRKRKNSSQVVGQRIPTNISTFNHWHKSNKTIKGSLGFDYFDGTRVWAQGPTLAMQVIYHLSHSTSPVLCWIKKKTHKLNGSDKIKEINFKIMMRTLTKLTQKM
jgi:hypothetical protein